ncbi:hypothetical protein JCM16303_003618 [Sporobolomyces ruberrimus]
MLVGEGTQDILDSVRSKPPISRAVKRITSRFRGTLSKIRLAFIEVATAEGGAPTGQAVVVCAVPKEATAIDA